MNKQTSTLLIILVILAFGGGFYAYTQGIFGGTTEEAPVETIAETPEPTQSTPEDLSDDEQEVMTDLLGILGDMTVEQAENLSAEEEEAIRVQLEAFLNNLPADLRG